MPAFDVRSFALALVLACLPLAGFAQYRLVTGAPKGVFAAPEASPRILRHRAVGLDLPAVSKASTHAAATLEIAFFEDAVFHVRLQRSEPTHSGGIAYTGVVAGFPHSAVILVDNAGTLSLRVHVPGGRFSIRGSSQTGYVAREHVDADKPAHDPKHERQVPVGGHVLLPDSLKSLPVEDPPPPTAADDGSSIDVMVVYTQAARVANGGTAQVHAEVDADIAQANVFYANSNVVQRLRLVHKGEVTYTEVNMDVDLPRLVSVGDGFLDEVPVLRDLYRADVVSLWGVYSDYCGLGYQMTTESGSFAGFAYNVVDSPDCTGPGTRTLAHELGHNMGLLHEGYVDSTPTTNLTPEAGGPAVNVGYARGYVDLVNHFRTIMAYGSQCPTLGFSCGAIPHFSNPSVTYDNRAFYGAASPTAPTGNASSGNERQALNDTRDTTANFRQQLGSFTGPGWIVFTPANPSVAEGAGSVTLRVGRHLGSTGAVSVSYATSPGTALAGSDFTATSGTLAWANGDAADKTITVPILQDAALEGHQAFTVTLSAPTGGASILAGSGVATVRILDDEADTFPAGSSLPAGYTSPNAPNAYTPNSQWSVDTTDGYLSTASFRSAQARSPTNTFSTFGYSDLEYTGTLNAGTLTFYYKLSSYHNGYAGFEFQVDGVTAFANDVGGEVGWTLVSVPVTAGPHTLRWRFKNKLYVPCTQLLPAPPGGGACADRAWVDAISFPTVPFTLTVARSGTGSGTVGGAGINCGPDCTETVGSGTVIALAATPTTGSTFSGWSGAGCSGTGACNVTVDANKTATATFTLNRYRVEVIAGPNGIVEAPPGPFDHGSTVQVYVVPDPGYVAAVSGTCPAGSFFRDIYTTGRLGMDCTVVFTFSPLFTLTVAKAGTGGGTISGPGISCGVDCSEIVGSGTVVALSATPVAGSIFSGWSGAGCGGTGGCSVTVDANKTATATFTLQQYTVSASAGANGSISPASTQVFHGSPAVFTVTASPGYDTSISGTCPAGSLVGTTYTTGPITGACSVTATFAPPMFMLTVERQGSGSGSVNGNGISCGSDCSEKVVSGSRIEMVATAATGSTFAGWSGARCSGTGPCIVTVDADYTVTATFTLNQYTVSASAGANGSISPVSQQVGHGSTASFTVTPATNYTAAMGGTCPAGSLVGSTYTTGTITGACSVMATFNLAASVPGAPGIGTATGGNAQATVQFTAPASNGGAGITSYTVTSSPGAITATGAGSPITVGGLANGTAYTFSVTATNSVGTGPPSGASNSVTPADPNPPRLGNISTRMQVLTGNDVMIGGFVIGGTASKTVAIVATGPSLSAFGIANPLPNPTMALVRSSDQQVITANDDWQAHPDASQLQAAGFAPSNLLEAAILVTLPPGAYTAIVQGMGGGTGVAVVGVYEVGGPEIPLVNISTRGRVLTGNDVMIGGFVVTGSGPQTVAIVATGPSLASFGITSPLANPTITLVRSSDQAVLATNDDWQSDASSPQLQAAGFAPPSPLESGLYRTLAPGAYTVIVQGMGGGTGVAVVGVYRVN
jgi:hypothetical protein